MIDHEDAQLEPNQALAEHGRTGRAVLHRSETAPVAAVTQRDDADAEYREQRGHGHQEHRLVAQIDQADAVLIVARTEDSKTGKLKPALFIVPTDSPGFVKTQMEMDIIEPDHQFILFLDDVRLPADALVGEADAALMQLFAGLNPERILGASMAIGMGRYALNAAVKFANERTVWKTPIDLPR